MSLDYAFHVNKMILKLPPSWHDYMTKLIHECDDTPLDILIHHLRVEGLSIKKEKKTKTFEKDYVIEAKPKGQFTPNKREFKKSAKGKKKAF